MARKPRREPSEFALWLEAIAAEPDPEIAAVMHIVRDVLELIHHLDPAAVARMAARRQTRLDALEAGAEPAYEGELEMARVAIWYFRPNLPEA